MVLVSWPILSNFLKLFRRLRETISSHVSLQYTGILCHASPTRANEENSHYPFQTCGDICGVAAVVELSLILLSPATFQTLFGMGYSPVEKIELEQLLSSSVQSGSVQSTLC